MFSISLYLTLGVVKSAVKHSATYKPNQQINGKEGKGKKKRNDSRIALNRPTESSEDICTFLKNSKRIFHQPVCFTRIWKNTLRLERLLCQISVFKFIGNSVTISFCVRRS